MSYHAKLVNIFKTVTHLRESLTALPYYTFHEQIFIFCVLDTTFFNCEKKMKAILFGLLNNKVNTKQEADQDDV